MAFAVEELLNNKGSYHVQIYIHIPNYLFTFILLIYLFVFIFIYLYEKEEMHSYVVSEVPVAFHLF